MPSPSTTNRVLPVPPPSASLFAVQPPVATVYLTTEGARSDAREVVRTRWKNLRRRLEDQGAPEAASDAIERLLAGAHSKGETLVAVANEQGLLFDAHLPETPMQDQAFVGPLPTLAPLLAVTQSLLPHVVVAIDRVGAEMVAVLPETDDVRRDVEGKQLHVTRSAPGGWSQRRFQQRAENRWKANASQVAEELTRLVDRTAPRLVVVSGDVRAVASLREQLPDRVAGLFAEVQGDYSDLDEAMLRAAELVEARAKQDEEELLADFRRERGQQDRSAKGPEDTLAALANGQVEAVLVDPAKTDDRTAWFGPELARVALFREVVAATGVDSPVEARLTDVIIRAALGTGAAIRIVDGAPELGPTGTGALLRYT